MIHVLVAVARNTNNAAADNLFSGPIKKRDVQEK